MDTYKIEFSDTTHIGGAYDEFHHEIAQIKKFDDGEVKVEFRSKDFFQPMEIVDDHTCLLKFEDGREIKIYGEGENVYLLVGEDKVDVTYPEFNYQSSHGTYNFTFDDKDNLKLETDSDEIVMAISASLGLMAYLHNH